MAEFLEAYRRTAIHEGGYANVKGDRGGETYKGIARVYHPHWEGWKLVDRAKPLRHNAFIKSDVLDSLVKQFYKRHFWDKIQGDYIRDQRTAEFLYDYMVHSGKRAIVRVQRILGVWDDGILGNITLRALNNADPDDVFNQLKSERRTFLRGLASKPGQSKFLKGWMNRIDSFV